MEHKGAKITKRFFGFFQRCGGLGETALPYWRRFRRNRPTLVVVLLFQVFLDFAELGEGGFQVFDDFGGDDFGGGEVCAVFEGVVF